MRGFLGFLLGRDVDGADLVGRKTLFIFFEISSLFFPSVSENHQGLKAPNRIENSCHAFPMAGTCATFLRLAAFLEHAVFRWRYF